MPIREIETSLYPLWDVTDPMAIKDILPKYVSVSKEIKKRPERGGGKVEDRKK